MPEQMKVAAQEHGLIRLFAVDLPRDSVADFQTRSFENAQDLWPLRDALAASYLDDDFIELFDIADLEDLGLAGYMVQGLGIAQADVDAMRPQINQVQGHVLIVLSNAFDGIAQDLSPQAPLRWIGTFEEEGADVQFKPLLSEAAKPKSGHTVEDKPVPAINPHLAVLIAIVATPLVIGLVALLTWLVLR